MNKDLLNLICSHLDVDDFYMLKDTYKLNVQYYCKNSAYHNEWVECTVCYYCRKGYLEIVKHYIQQNPHLIDLDRLMMCTASKAGHLEIVQYLDSIGACYMSDVMYHAVEKGHLEIVKYLHSVNKDSLDDLVNVAVEKGHLEILKYLYSVGKNSTYDLVNIAATNGHLEIIKYLCSIGKVCTNYAMDSAIRCGYIEIVKYFHSVGFIHEVIEGCPAEIVAAIINSQFEIVKYLFSIGVHRQLSADDMIYLYFLATQCDSIVIEHSHCDSIATRSKSAAIVEFLKPLTTNHVFRSIMFNIACTFSALYCAYNFIAG